MIAVELSKGPFKDLSYKDYVSWEARMFTNGFSGTVEDFDEPNLGPQSSLNVYVRWVDKHGKDQSGYISGKFLILAADVDINDFL